MVEPQKEVWVQLVALTILIFAICAAVSAVEASRWAFKAQLDAAKEARQWADYQAMGLKGESYGAHLDFLAGLKQLEGKNFKTPKNLAAKAKDYEEEKGRLEKAKSQLKIESEDLAKRLESLQTKSGAFALAVILMQIAIGIAAVGALIRTKILGFLGLALGIWGLVYMAKGFLP